MKGGLSGFAVFTACLCLAGCGGGGEQILDPPETPSVRIAGQPVTLEALGGTAQLSAEVVRSDGTPDSGAGVTWRSEAPTVFSVGATGLITALDNGSGSVVASSGGGEGRLLVTVRQRAQTLEISTTRDAFDEVGVEHLLDRNATDPRGNAITSLAFTWTSSDPSVLSVTSAGQVRSEGTGSAEITASLNAFPRP